MQPKKRTALYLAKPFGWRASNLLEAAFPHDLYLTFGDYKVDDTYPEVSKS